MKIIKFNRCYLTLYIILFISFLLILYIYYLSKTEHLNY